MASFPVLSIVQNGQLILKSTATMQLGSCSRPHAELEITGKHGYYAYLLTLPYKECSELQRFHKPLVIYNQGDVDVIWASVASVGANDAYNLKRAFGYMKVIE